MLETLSTTIIHFIQSTGYIGILILMTLESVFIPIPSEVTMPFGGFLAHQGILSLPWVILAGALGNLIGSLLGYAVGYFLEEKVLINFIKKYGKFILISEEDYITSKKWFDKYGDGVVLVSRLLPAIRTYISLPAGMFAMNIWKFSIYTFVGSLVWSGALAFFGFYLGSKWSTLGPIFNKFHLVIIAAVAGLLGLYIYHKVHKRKKKLSV